MDSEKMLIVKLGEIVLNSRRARKMTQEELAKASGASKMTVQRLEVAAGATKIDNFISIMYALGLRLTEVFREAESGIQRHEEKLEITSWKMAQLKINQMCESDQEWMGQVILKMIDKPERYHHEVVMNGSTCGANTNNFSS